MFIKNKVIVTIFIVIFIPNQSYGSTAAQTAAGKQEIENVGKYEAFQNKVYNLYGDTIGGRGRPRSPQVLVATSVLESYNELSLNEKKQADVFLTVALNNYLQRIRDDSIARKIKHWSKQWRNYLTSFSLIDGFKRETTISQEDWEYQFKSDEQKKEEEERALANIPGTPQYTKRMEQEMNQIAQAFEARIQSGKKNMQELLQHSPGFVNNSEYKKLKDHNKLVESMQKQVEELDTLMQQLRLAVQPTQVPSTASTSAAQTVSTQSSAAQQKTDK